MHFASTDAPAPDAGVLELDWQTFGELCRALAMRVANSGYEPEMVVGIAKAGVIPGAVVASILRCDFYSLKITRREGDEVRERPVILSEAPRQAAGKRILIVDEICTSGATLRTATNAMRNVHPEEIRTATSLVRLGGHKPDYSALETEALVVFPWDRQVIGEEGEIVVNPIYRGLL